MVSLRGLTLTAARPRIIVPLFARDPAALCPLAKAASADPAAELVELRLDPLPADEFLNALALVRGIVDKPLVVTIRTRAEGGELALTPDAYAVHCRALLAHGGVDVLDIEWRACGAFRAELSNDDGERFVFGLDAAQQLYTDRTHSAHSAFSDTFDSGCMSVTKTLRLLDGNMRLQLHFDRCVAELYADGGTYANTTLVFPDRPYTRISITGDATLRVVGE